MEKSKNNFLVFIVFVCTMLTTPLFAEALSSSVMSEDDGFLHFEELVEGNLVGSYQKSDAKRQEAIDQFKEKCEKFQADVRANAGDHLGYVEDCEGYRVTINYRYSSSVSTKKVTGIAVYEEHLVPPLKEGLTTFSYEMLGYIVHKKMIVDIVLPPGTKTQKFTKEIKTVNPAPLVNTQSSKSDYLLRTYDFQQQHSETCKRLLSGMQAQQGQRLIFTNCRLQRNQPHFATSSSNGTYKVYDFVFSSNVMFDYWLANI